MARPREPGPAVAGGRPPTLLVALGLFVVVLLLYAPTARHEFVHWDDNTYILDNPMVTEGLSVSGVRWAFTSFHASNWHPLTWLSHMLDVELFGLEPAGHHLVSVLLHATSSVLLFVALWRMTAAFWPSALVAALFAVHPLRVESVAWVSERKDVLSGLFWMLTLLAWSRYVVRPRPGRYATVLVAFAAGLLSKPMLVTLPGVLLLLDWWPLRRARALGNAPGGGLGAARLVLEKLPLFALSAGSGLLTVLAQRAGGAVSPLEHLPLAARLSNALVAWLGYLRKTVWPLDLACFYPHPMRPTVWALPAAALLVAMTALALREARRRPYLVVGWLWYLGTLVPVIGIVQVGMQSMADRYAYLPLIGVYLAAVWGGAELARRWPEGRTLLTLAVSLLLLGFVTATWLQIGVWRDSRALFTHAARVTPDNHIIRNNLGNVHLRAGELDAAEAQYREAIRLNPNYAMGHNNLGNALFQRGDFAGAAEHYRIALRLQPDYVKAHNNLGIILQRRGDLAGAAGHFQEAIRADATYAEAHNNLGTVFERQGRLAEAKRAFERTIELNPRHAEAYNNLGVVSRKEGDLERATAWFERAVAVDPSYAGAYNNLGSVYESQERLDLAETHYGNAIRVKPDYSEAHNNLGVVYAKQGRLAEAAAQLEQAIRVKPDNAGARRNLERVRALQAQAGG